MAGPYYFAWADEEDEFNSVTHAVEDDDIFEFEIEHNEGDFATLRIQIENPRIGLLAPGRKRWAWFSWFNGTIIVPLFFGRLVGLPEQIQDELVEINLIARPSDFVDQKLAVAATLKVRPYWDPIWFSDDTRDNPDNVLESRPELWHIDRLTRVVTTSNIINGEDGTLTFTDDQIFYDYVKTSYDQNPLRTINMTATVSWDQTSSGGFPVRHGKNGLSDNIPIQSYTGSGLAEAWPKPGSSLGGGWSCISSSAIVDGEVDPQLVGDPTPNWTPEQPHYQDRGFDTKLGSFGITPPGEDIGWSYHVTIPNIKVYWKLSIGWDVSRRKTEVIKFSLSADVQDLLTDPDDDSALDLNMASSELNGAIDPGDLPPIGKESARSFFTTDRGAESIEYLIALTRSHLIARARAVSISFEISFPLAVLSDLSCRQNAAFSDSRLPGTDVGGKIIQYRMAMSDGKQSASITIGCVIGKDGEITEEEGTPDYCEADYVGSDYQTYTGLTILPFASDVAYERILGTLPNDDGIDFDMLSANIIKDFSLSGGNGPDETQIDALDRFDITVDNSGHVDAENTNFAEVHLTLPSLIGGPFQTDYVVNVTDLKIPKTINLEAP